MLWANVRSDGALAIAASSPGTGGYIVTFDQDVTNCAAVATSGGFPGFDFAANNVTVDTDISTVVTTQVFVSLRHGESAAPVDSSFHLVVVCND